MPLVQPGSRPFRNHPSGRLTCQFSVHHAPNTKRIFVFQFVGQSYVRKILIADGAGESKNRQSTDGSGARIRAGRIWATVNYGIAELQTRGVTVVNNSPDFIFEDGDELGEFDDVLLGAVNSGGEMAMQAVSGFQDLFLIRVVDEQSFRPKNFAREIWVGEERGDIRLKQRWRLLETR